MTNKTIHFNTALQATVDFMTRETFPKGVVPLVIRDIQGRIRIGLEHGDKEKHKKLAERLAISISNLAPFAGDIGNAVLFPDDFFDPDSIFKNSDILAFYYPGVDTSLRLLDRQVVGQDWLRPGEFQSRIPRLVFFGLKGGVGRSTALTILAYELARAGKRVLVIDFDLESPGLSGLLMPSDCLSDFGVVDWFVEDAVGQGNLVIDRIIAVSPLSEHTQGEIRVAAAMGISENFYLAKLSRVYAEVTRQEKVERFSERTHRFLTELEQRERPDVVLIDSRAGLHDLAAVSTVGLATDVLLFGADSAQTWQGYRLLFSHWQAYPDVLRMVRDRLIMVEALFPELNQAERAERFLEHAYTLFSETIYERIEPGAKADPELFNFDINDTDAAHYPLRIKWNSRFQEFDPLLIPKGILSDADITASFGEFLDGVKQRVMGGVS